MYKFWSKWRNETLFAFGVLLLALLLRIKNLTILPVFADEAIYIRWSQLMQSVPSLRFIPLSDGKQPLFMWVVIPFLKLFEDPLFAGRFVSVLSGVGTLVGVVTLSILLFRSIKAALIAGLLYALSPFSVFFDRLALSDSMLSFFGIWTLVLGVLTVKKLRIDTAMLAGLSLGGALITKSPGLYFGLMMPLTFAFTSWPKSFKEKISKIFIYIFLFTLTFVFAFGVYNILRLGPEFHMIAIRNKDYVYPLSHIITSPLDPLVPFLDRTLEYFWILGPSTFVVLFFLGLITGLKEYPKETLVLALWSILPIIASSEFSKTMTARYVYFSLPCFVVIASMCYLNFPLPKKNWFKNGYYFSISFLFLILFILQAIYIDFGFITNPQKVNLPRSERSGYLEEWTSGYGIKEISEILKKEVQNLPEGKQVVVGTEGHFGTLPDGLQIYMNNTPKVTVIGVGQPVYDLSNSLTESKEFGNKTFLVVNDSRFLGDSESLGLKLLSSYPKAVKPDGTRESLLLFEVN